MRRSEVTSCTVTGKVIEITLPQRVMKFRVTQPEPTLHPYCMVATHPRHKAFFFVEQGSDNTTAAGWGKEINDSVELNVPAMHWQ